MPPVRPHASAPLDTYSLAPERSLPRIFSHVLDADKHLRKSCHPPLPFMKEYKPSDIRNFAIVGHASSGKTMLSEAMLECAGVINRMGSIAAGSTVSDYHDNEKQRQISVSASLM